MRASQFFSRQKHEEGIQVPLPLPDGSESGEFVVLMGRDSRIFRKAQSDYRNRMMIAKVDQKEFDEYTEGIKLTASAIKSWTLEDELSQEAAVEMLTNAPYILDALDSALYDNKRFFVGKE